MSLTSVFDVDSIINGCLEYLRFKKFCDNNICTEGINLNNFKINYNKEIEIFYKFKNKVCQVHITFYSKSSNVQDLLIECFKLLYKTVSNKEDIIIIISIHNYYESRGQNKTYTGRDDRGAPVREMYDFMCYWG